MCLLYGEYVVNCSMMEYIVNCLKAEPVSPVLLESC